MILKAFEAVQDETQNCSLSCSKPSPDRSPLIGLIGRLSYLLIGSLININITINNSIAYTMLSSQKRVTNMPTIVQTP